MSTTATKSILRVMDLGGLAYSQAMAAQARIHEQVLQGHAPSTLILVEHDPVVTFSRRPSALGHLLVMPEALTAQGIDLQPTDRGGDITYHGPGQLVAYPILKLNDMRMNISRYMRWLELVVIETVAAFGVTARIEPGCTGVWTAGSRDETPKKLCALGVRVQRGVTMHGLALNVTTNLDHFKLIVPCGLVGRGVTSLQDVLGNQTPSMSQVKNQLVDVIERRHP